MEQEEEWEREGLLDPAWEKQQKKVSAQFTPPTLLPLSIYIFYSLSVKWIESLETLRPLQMQRTDTHTQLERYFSL